MSDPDVQEALHVGASSLRGKLGLLGEWSQCSDEVNENWAFSDYLADTTYLYSRIYNHPNKPKDFKMLIFSGDNDGVSFGLSSPCLEEFFFKLFAFCALRFAPRLEHKIGSMTFKGLKLFRCTNPGLISVACMELSMEDSSRNLLICSHSLPFTLVDMKLLPINPRVHCICLRVSCLVQFLALKLVLQPIRHRIQRQT